MISEPTRFREGNNPSLLDLILSTFFNFVGSLKYEAPFNKSAHFILLLEIKSSYSAKKNIKPEGLDFIRLDYKEFRNDLNKV